MNRIAIIGAGLTGLTAARVLQEAGHAPVIFDKGRGIGGRLSTRRADGGLQFDHGAQYLTAKSPGFAAFLAALETTSAAAPWSLSPNKTGTVGTPGMSSLAKHLAQGLTVQQQVEVPPLSASAGGWTIAGETFSHLLCTTPAPQAAALIGADHPLHKALQSVEMAPNLTLMLALPEGSPRPFISRRDADDDIAWLARDTAKPGRGRADCWVAQASLGFSLAQLELDKPAIAAAMLPLVCARLDADPATALYVSGHRWRYAQTLNPLGTPFLQDGRLFIGGDWALGARAEHAWQSGTAMATALLNSL